LPYIVVHLGAGIVKNSESPGDITKFSFIEIVGAKELTNAKAPSPITRLPTTNPITVLAANIIK